MGKLPKAFIPAFCFLLLTPCIFAGKKELTVRIWLFQGTSVEGQAALSQVEIIPLSSSPALSAAKSLAGGPENDFKSAVIEALLDMKGLKTIDDLFLSKLRQTEDLPFPDKSVLGKQMAYRIDLSYKVLSPTLMGLRVVLSKTKEGVVPQGKGDRQMLRDAYNATRDMDKMDNIVDQELTLGFDNPVIVGIPNQRRPYFMVVKLTANEPAPKRRTMPMIKMPPVVNLIPAPQPLDKVLPIYPDELRRRGIKGDVGLRIAINEKGIVRMVQVLASLNPYLDYSGSQALWLWKFEPVLKNGKPVPAVFDYTFNFDPRAYSEGMTYVEGGPTAMDETSREELRRILGECAEYCRKLADVALSYIC
ncbi:MAG: energy transducer TonB, partial [Candidatus Aminicenantales bacterium]